MSATDTGKQVVLLVLPWSPSHPGGVSIVVRCLAQQFANRGVESSVVVSDWAARQPELSGEGLLHFKFSLFHGANVLRLAKSILALPLRALRTHQLLHAHGVTAVNFHYAGLDALVIALLKRVGLYDGILVLSFHGTDARQPGNKIEKWLWTWLLNSADSVTACSFALAQQVERKLGTDIERISVLHNGVDSAQFSPRKARTMSGSAPLPSRYVVSIGSYISRKGHHVLLDAFREVAGDFTDVGLVIVGMDGDERMPLIARAEAFGLADRVTCLVNLDQDAVAEIVSNAAVCVQPSFAEPFGLAVIEAGACGVPIIASAVGGHLEILQDRQTGLLFPIGNVHQCASLLREVLRDPIAAGAFAVRFRTEVLQRFTWQACADNYLQLLCRARGGSTERALQGCRRTAEGPGNAARNGR